MGGDALNVVCMGFQNVFDKVPSRLKTIVKGVCRQL